MGHVRHGHGHEQPSHEQNEYLFRYVWCADIGLDSRRDTRTNIITVNQGSSSYRTMKLQKKVS